MKKLLIPLLFFSSASYADCPDSTEGCWKGSTASGKWQGNINVNNCGTGWYHLGPCEPCWGEGHWDTICNQTYSSCNGECWIGDPIIRSPRKHKSASPLQKNEKTQKKK